VELGGLLYNGSDSMSFNDTPHEERDTRGGTTTAFSVNRCRLFEKDVGDLGICLWGGDAHLVDREPNCGQRNKGEKEET